MEALQSASNSLDRALVILELVEQVPGGLKNAEICRRLGIATSSCSYILSRLEQRGYLTRDEEGRYQIGLTTLALAYGALRDMGFLDIAEPTLYGLANHTGLSASIGVLQRGRVLLIDRVESPKFFRDAAEFGVYFASRRENRQVVVSSGRMRRREQREIGRELPVHSNALGKAMLAHLPRSEALEIIEREGLTPCTPHTIVSKSEFMAELDQTKARGYAISREEQYSGVYAVGVPFLDGMGIVRGAVSVNGSPSESIWDEENLPDLVESVSIAARDISKRARFR